jgi:sterol desaturase/sphingolipid hydroxylase (fatty acid hydroxylase superfamily)
MMQLWAAGAALGVLALTFVPLELAFRARRQPILRREWATDLAFFLGQYWVCSGLVVAVFEALSACVDPRLITFQRAVAEQPLWLQAAQAVLLGDLLIYWAHRFSHRVEWLWRFHRVHHTAEHLDWLAAYREHPLDGLYSQFWINLPGILMGFPIELIGGIVVFRSMWGVFIHSNVKLPIGWLRFVTGSPELHHWHHDRTHGGRCNFANLMPLMDLIFGTYRHPPAEAEAALGVQEVVPRNYLGQLLYPMLPASLRARFWASDASE